MTKLIISAILIISTLSIANFPSFTCARKQLASHEQEEAWFQNIMGAKEYVKKLHFYVQDVLGRDNPTVYEVARASTMSNSVTSFGQVRVLDDLITAEPEANSTKLGQLQGLITFSDLQTSALSMNLNFYFIFGPNNGSSLCILGRNQIMNEEREFLMVGGTGVFRFARGYALSSTYSYDVETNYGVLEYTIYVTSVNKSSRNLEAAI